MDLVAAREIFESMLACRTSLGLLSEDIDPKTNELYVADGYVNRRVIVSGCGGLPSSQQNNTP